MDVKGMNWIGSIYQKFETMCLEVEEIVYQLLRRYSAQDSQLMKGAEQTESRSVSESLVTTTWCPSKAFGVVPCTENIVQLSLRFLSKNQRTVNHPDATVSSAGVEVEKGDSMKGSRDENGHKTRCINESSADVPTITDNNIEVECVGNDGQTENSPLSTDSYGTSSSNAFLPNSTASSDVKEASYIKVFYTENTDSAHTAHTGGDASIEHNLSILDNPDWRNLEESCIFIDVDGCRSEALSRGKRRSYKKTIRDVFLSKKKASRTQEYEKHAALYGDPKSTQDCSCELGKGRTSDAHGSSECEWEIL